MLHKVEEFSIEELSIYDFLVRDDAAFEAVVNNANKDDDEYIKEVIAKKFYENMAELEKCIDILLNAHCDMYQENKIVQYENNVMSRLKEFEDGIQALSNIAQKLENKIADLIEFDHHQATYADINFHALNRIKNIPCDIRKNILALASQSETISTLVLTLGLPKIQLRLVFCLNLLLDIPYIQSGTANDLSNNYSYILQRLGEFWYNEGAKLSPTPTPSSEQILTSLTLFLMGHFNKISLLESFCYEYILKNVLKIKLRKNNSFDLEEFLNQSPLDFIKLYDFLFRRDHSFSKYVNDLLEGKHTNIMFNVGVFELYVSLAYQQAHAKIITDSKDKSETDSKDKSRRENNAFAYKKRAIAYKQRALLYKERALLYKERAKKKFMHCLNSKIPFSEELIAILNSHYNDLDQHLDVNIKLAIFYCTSDDSRRLESNRRVYDKLITIDSSSLRDLLHALFDSWITTPLYPELTEYAIGGLRSLALNGDKPAHEIIKKHAPTNENCALIRAEIALSHNQDKKERIRAHTNLSKFTNSNNSDVFYKIYLLTNRRGIPDYNALIKAAQKNHINAKFEISCVIRNDKTRSEFNQFLINESNDNNSTAAFHFLKTYFDDVISKFYLVKFILKNEVKSNEKWIDETCEFFIFRSDNFLLGKISKTHLIDFYSDLIRLTSDQNIMHFAFLKLLSYLKEDLQYAFDALINLAKIAIKYAIKITECCSIHFSNIKQNDNIFKDIIIKELKNIFEVDYINTLSNEKFYAIFVIEKHVTGTMDLNLLHAGAINENPLALDELNRLLIKPSIANTCILNMKKLQRNDIVEFCKKTLNQIASIEGKGQYYASQALAIYYLNHCEYFEAKKYIETCHAIDPAVIYNTLKKEGYLDNTKNSCRAVLSLYNTKNSCGDILSEVKNSLIKREKREKLPPSVESKVKFFDTYYKLYSTTDIIELKNNVRIQLNRLDLTTEQRCNLIDAISQAYNVDQLRTIRNDISKYPLRPPQYQ